MCGIWVFIELLLFNNTHCKCMWSKCFSSPSLHSSISYKTKAAFSLLIYLFIYLSFFCFLKKQNEKTNEKLRLLSVKAHSGAFECVFYTINSPKSKDVTSTITKQRETADPYMWKPETLLCFKWLNVFFSALACSPEVCLNAWSKA